MKKTLGLVLAALLPVVLMAWQARAQYVIAEDRGGQIGSYIDKYKPLQGSNQRIVIAGLCASACTIVLGTVPHGRICVTPRAKLGFHAAWNFGQGGTAVINTEATKLLFGLYPPKIQTWIQERGGLTSKMLWLEGRQLHSFFPLCQEPVSPSDESATFAERWPH